ncbi:MAG TPA: SRPBCC family protein [Kofleriaceae bacterium]|nr:SRPBCC family protein [Kofleriaceae bacterium]
MKSLQAFTRRDPGHERSASDGSTLARGLGVLSLGLGMTELAAPELLAKAIGLRPSSRTSFVLRAFGMREVLAGLGVLLQPRRPLPLWARLAGDALDLAAIGWAAKTQRTRVERLAAAAVAVAGAAALDAVAARRVKRAQRTVIDPVIFSVTINKPPAQVYAFWRKLENLPLFMDFLESVTELGGGTQRSHWVAVLPVGGTVAWDAEITEDRPGEKIAWRTVEGGTFAHRGEVTFARTPGRDMTEVRVQLELGLLGQAPSIRLAKLLTKPQIKGDLRRLKQVLETGEVVRSDASIHKGPHPAQPPAEAPPPLPATGVRPVPMTSHAAHVTPTTGIAANRLAGAPSTTTTTKGRPS